MISNIVEYIDKFKSKNNRIECVRDLIPIEEINSEGIFRMGDEYSKSYSFTDINYSVESEERKEQLFLLYEAVINSIDSDMRAKITLNNRNNPKNRILDNVEIKCNGDRLDEYRKEYNDIIKVKSLKENNTIKEMYLTLTTTKKDFKEASDVFRTAEAILKSRFSSLGSNLRTLCIDERLSIIGEFLNAGDNINIVSRELCKRGESYKDVIAPDSAELNEDYIKCSDSYVRSLFLKNYPSYLRDDFIQDLIMLKKNMMLSIDIIPVSTEEAIKEIEKRLLGVETNITNWQRKQNNNKNYSAQIPYDMSMQREEAREFLNDISSRDQRMMFVNLTISHSATSKEKLDLDTETICATSRRHLCTLGVLKYQQVEGLNTSLIYGVQQTEFLRTLTTESLAVMTPFSVQDITHDGGIYYGQNAVSSNMIIVDRKKLMNGNSFILGVSGSGKSFAAKEEIASLVLRGDSDVIVIDPEREYSKLIKELGGTVVDISSSGNNCINVMDMISYKTGEVDPIKLKSEFIMTLCNQLMGNPETEVRDQSIVDRCVRDVFSKYRRNYRNYRYPILSDFRKELLNQPEPEAANIALALEVFTDGSLNVFNGHTNVNVENSLVCYDIHGLGEQLRTVGMLIVLDNIMNRIAKNKNRGKNTYIFIDEIYLLFSHGYTAEFLFSLWKRVRKYGAFCTGITQNVDDLLQSHTARTMLANSEFIIMLNQAATDRIELAKLLNISDTQLTYLSGVNVGNGLMKIGSNMVPFNNSFPINTKLFSLMSTDIRNKI